MRPAALLIALAAARAQDCRVVPLSPAQPPAKVEEGERATESQTFQTNALALSPTNAVHFFDSAFRIRRIDNGRMVTLVGTGTRADAATPGPARDNGLPSVSQIAFSATGVLHFVAAGRVMRLVDNRIEAVAGTGRPGFNGESGPAVDINLGTIVNIAFDNSGALLILDGFNRLRRVGADGNLATIAGSTRPAAAAGFTGDNGPAAEASLSSPRQVLMLRNGIIWIKDLSGRHLRTITPDGVIRTINPNFEPTVNIILLPDGTPAAATANRLYPIRPNGQIETGAAPYPPFTGTPLAIDTDGAMLFLGSARPEQRNPLVRLGTSGQSVVAGAPTVPDVDGQSPPFGVWHPRNNSLLYAAAQGGKSGIVEVRAGQSPRFVVGGGDDIGDPEGKSATSIAVFGIAAFSVDAEGRIVLADANRRRILVVGTDGKVSVLKSQGGEVVYAPLGTFSSLQRIAADPAGNIYWYRQGATPTGGVFTADIDVWNRSTQAITTVTVAGLGALSRLDDGATAVLAGNSGTFRSVYPIAPNGQSAAMDSFRMLPLGSVTRFRGRPYFTAASRLFRNDPGRIEMLDIPAIPVGATPAPDFVLASPDNVIVHLNDGGFYRIDNIDACKWTPQPAIARDGIVNAASFEWTNRMSPRQLLTIFGTGLGPAEGQGLVLDGVLRAGGQPAPYPAMVLGNFSGAIPNATVTGTALPVIHSNDKQVTVAAVAAVAAVPASGSYLLYFSWQGLTLIHPQTVEVSTATPGLFTVEGTRDGSALAIDEGGERVSRDNAARRGAVVQLFGTGFGALDTNPTLGDFLSLTVPTNTTNRVTAVIGEESAEVLFAGGAPGQIGGVYRIDVRIPDTLEPGEHRVVLSVAEQPTPAEQVVTIAVR
jgi:uncharacterized protein (TIGR03437 family)